MKKISVLTLILFAAAAAAFAQEKTIDKTEFDKVYKSSFRWTANESYRETDISNSTIEFIPQTNIAVSTVMLLPPHSTTMKTINEFVPNGGYRIISEFEADGMKKRYERIRLAGKTYKREGNGAWEEETLQNPAPPPHEVRTKTEDKQTEYKFLGIEKLNDRNTNVYEQIEKSKVVSLTRNETSDSITTTKYWFSEDGNLLKTESKREIHSAESIGRFNSTRTIELDSTIKIEAPDLGTAK